MNAITDDAHPDRHPAQFVDDVLGDVLTGLITAGTITVDLYANAVEVTDRRGDQLTCLLGAFTVEQATAMFHVHHHLITDRTAETFIPRNHR